MHDNISLNCPYTTGHENSTSKTTGDRCNYLLHLASKCALKYTVSLGYGGNH